MLDHISVKGARANNLKNIDVTIPRDKLVVLTGLSGSGKSSLAFDTIYAEGQRDVYKRQPPGGVPPRPHLDAPLLPVWGLLRVRLPGGMLWGCLLYTSRCV